jgi:hypothetical protein
MSAHAVIWAKPSIARPGAETMVLRLPDARFFRGYEQEGDEPPQALTHKFELDQAVLVAEKLLRGDPHALGDARAMLLVAAALLALLGEHPKPPRDIEVPEPVKAGALG